MLIISERVRKCYYVQPKSQSVKSIKNGLGSESEDFEPANTNRGLGSFGWDVSGLVIAAGVGVVAAGGVAAGVAA